MSTEATLDDEQLNLRGGHITGVGMLDLTSAKIPEDLQYIRSIQGVGAILIPEHLAAVLAAVKMQNVGAIIPIPSGDHVDVITGQTKLTGESLAAGDPETVLAIVGQVVITSRVDKVGYKALQIFGQVLAPKGSETALSSKTKRLTGQIVYYTEGARFFIGSETINAEFLSLLSASTAFLIMGELTFSSDITVELLKEKVSEIALMGAISVPTHLAALVQFLTVEKMGEIQVRE